MSRRGCVQAVQSDQAAAALLVLVAAMVASGGEEAVVTFGCLLLAVVFILIPWDGGRLRLLYKSAADAPSSPKLHGERSRFAPLAGGAPRGAGHASPRCACFK